MVYMLITRILGHTILMRHLRQLNRNINQLNITLLGTSNMILTKRQLVGLHVDVKLNNGLVLNGQGITDRNVSHTTLRLRGNHIMLTSHIRHNGHHHRVLLITLGRILHDKVDLNGRDLTNGVIPTLSTHVLLSRRRLLIRRMQLKRHMIILATLRNGTIPSTISNTEIRRHILNVPVSNLMFSLPTLLVNGDLNGVRVGTNMLTVITRGAMQEVKLVGTRRRLLKLHDTLRVLNHNETDDKALANAAATTCRTGT